MYLENLFSFSSLFCTILFFIVICFINVRLRYKRLSQEDLHEKHVVVTGGSSGIGKSFAVEAVSRGAHVTIIARDKDKLTEAQKEIKEACVNPEQRVQIISLNICGKYEKTFDDLAESEKTNGPIFMLMNCAGNAVSGTLENTSPSDIKKMLDLNCLSSVLVTKAVIEGMKSRGEGHIILTSSQAGLCGIYGFAPYSASKFALRGFAEALCMEVKHWGIKVTVAFPPDTDTPGFQVEELTKPKETKLISDSSGLYNPDEVATKIMQDSLAGIFYSSIGFEGFMLTTLCSGMAPFFSIIHLIFEGFLMGLFRIIAGFYLLRFDQIILRCKGEKNKFKKEQ